MKPVKLLNFPRSLVTEHFKKIGSRCFRWLLLTSSRKDRSLPFSVSDRRFFLELPPGNKVHKGHQVTASLTRSVIFLLAHAHQRQAPPQIQACHLVSSRCKSFNAAKSRVHERPSGASVRGQLGWVGRGSSSKMINYTRNRQAS